MATERRSLAQTVLHFFDVRWLYHRASRELVVEKLATDSVVTTEFLAADGVRGLDMRALVAGDIPALSYAPTDADYLVGTANGSLSGEIVVGTTPGGELGGTWGSPTVDATHSGSAHHTRAHDMTGTSDHDAGTWKVFYSDGSGNVIELALGADGDVLTAGGAAAAPAFETPAAGSGDVATDTIWDALGDLAVGTGANTAAKLTKGSADDMTLRVSAAATTDLAWDSPAIFKRTLMIGEGDKTTTSTSFVAIDATDLPYLTFVLAIGESVLCLLSIGQYYSDSGSLNVSFDVEVDQPTSADTRIAADAQHGLMFTTNAGVRSEAFVMAVFTATEAGSHGFRPMWKTSTSTLRLANDTSGNDDTAVSFTAIKLGAPRA